MNFSEFGLGIGWVKVVVNVSLLVSLVGWGIRLFAAVVKALD